MSIWKKSASIVASAALLGSLLATAAVGTALAANGTVFSYTSVPVGPVAADGISHYTLTFGAENVAPGDVTVLQVAASGAYFLNGTGAAAFDPATSLTCGTLTYPRTSILCTDAADIGSGAGTLWLASNTAGTATVTVSLVSTTLGTVTDSLVSFSFSGATATSVSTSYSSTAVKGGTTHAAVAGATTSWARTVVADSNNNPIAAGATVTWTLSGPAYFNGGSAISGPTAAAELASGADNITHCGLNVSTVSCANSPLIFSTGIAGTVTVATTVSYLGVTYTLANKTLTLTGDLSKAVGSVNTASNDINLGADLADGDAALEVQTTDAAGNVIAPAAGNGANPGAGGDTIASFTATYTPANIFTLDLNAVYDSTDKAWDFDATCVTTGTATVTIKALSALSTATASTSALTLTCAEGLTATTVGTFTVTAASTSVAPNGSTTVSVNVLDDNGLPAPDGTPVLAVTNGVGNVVSSKLTGTATTAGGAATFTYLAPANAGSATVTVLVSHASPSSKSITLTIGGGAGGGLVCTAASAKGANKTSGFSAAAKTLSHGASATLKFSCGAAGAGAAVVIRRALSGHSSVAWTTRIADASGNVIMNVRSASAAKYAYKAGGNWVWLTWK